MAGALLKYNGQALQTPSGAYGINNLVPENVKSGVNIGGIVGTYTGSNPPLMVLEDIYNTSSTNYILSIPNVAFQVKRIIMIPNSIQTNRWAIFQWDMETTPTKNQSWRDNNGTLVKMPSNELKVSQSGTTLKIESRNYYGFSTTPSYTYTIYLIG